MLSTAVKRLCAFVSAVFLIVFAQAAFAAKAGNEAAVVARLYKDFAWQAFSSQSELFGEDILHQEKAVLDRYFSPSLTKLLLADAACQIKYQGICNLDSDLLFASQDPRVVDLEIQTVAPGKVSVVFADPQNQQRTRIDFHVMRIGGTWKIVDIIYKTNPESSLAKTLSTEIP